MSKLTYHREGDYLIPDLFPPEAARIGIWGMRRRNYLQQYHDGIYTGMLLTGMIIQDSVRVILIIHKAVVNLLRKYMITVFTELMRHV